MPVLMGEGGNSTSGNSAAVDDSKVGGKFATTQAILDTAGTPGGTIGYNMWLYDWHGSGGDADTLVNTGNNKLTDFGTQVAVGIASNTTASPILTMACQPNLTQPVASVTPSSTALAPVPLLPPTVGAVPPPSVVAPAPTAPADVSAELANDQTLLQQAQGEIAAVMAQIAALQQQQSSTLPAPVTDTSPGRLSVATTPVQPSPPSTTDMAPMFTPDSGGGGHDGGDTE